MFTPFCRHWYVRGGEPDTTAHRIVISPVTTLVLGGWTSKTGGVRTGTAGENSELLLARSVATAATNCVARACNSKVATKALLPLESRLSSKKPKSFWPSPEPEGLGWLFK